LLDLLPYQVSSASSSRTVCEASPPHFADLYHHHRTHDDRVSAAAPSKRVLPIIFWPHILCVHLRSSNCKHSRQPKKEPNRGRIFAESDSISASRLWDRSSMSSACQFPTY